MTQSKPSFEPLFRPGRVVDHAVFRRIVDQVAAQFPLPRIVRRGRKYVTQGAALAFEVQGLPLPDIDYYNGRLIKRNELLTNWPILASFRGGDGQIVVEASYDPDAGLLRVEVPPAARDGILVWLFPVVERFGTLESMKAIDPKGEILRKEVGVFREQQASESSECCDGHPDASQTLTCQAPHTRESGVCESVIAGAGVIVDIRYLVVYGGPLLFWCWDPCPIECPYGALQLHEEGMCSVDPDVCRGQWFTVDRDAPSDEVDGRRVLHRNPDLVCWECFGQGDGAFSSKCLRGRLGKVLHLGGACCGRCPDGTRVLGLRLDELCSSGAIYKLVEYEAPGEFHVDKDLCSGCQLCYDNLNCFNNIFRRCHYENTVRMTAYVGMPRWIPRVVLDRLRFTPVHRSDAASTFYFLVVADGSETVTPIALDEQRTCDLMGQHFDFSDCLHFAILSDGRQGTYRLAGFNRAGLNLPITTIERPSAFDRRAIRPARARIRTAIGEFEVEYTLERTDYSAEPRIHLWAAKE